MRAYMKTLYPDAEYTPEQTWSKVYIERLIGDPEVGCCQHLSRAAVQPAFYVPAWGPTWRCRPCFEDHGRRLAAEAAWGIIRTLDPVEDGTCDYCRTYVGELVQATISRGIWTVLAAVCLRCGDAMKRGDEEELARQSHRDGR
jgi:hypothetical protein